MRGAVEGGFRRHIIRSHVWDVARVAVEGGFRRHITGKGKETRSSVKQESRVGSS